MGKKKKKDAVQDLVSIGLKILKSGKLKLRKGYTISMEEISKESIDNTIGSRFEALEDNSKVSMENDPLLEISGQWCDPMHTYRMMSRLQEEGSEPITLVHVASRKHVERLFDYAGRSLIGELLRCSNLGTVYKAIHENWEGLLKNSKGMDCLLFIPSITVFADEELGIFTDKQTKVNLLLYVVKGKGNTLEDTTIFGSDTTEGEDEKKDEPGTVAARVLESAVRIGCGNLIIDPLSYKEYAKDVDAASADWHAALSEDRVNTHIKDITFCVDDDNDFIIFWKSRHPENRA